MPCINIIVLSVVSLLKDCVIGDIIFEQLPQYEVPDSSVS